MHQLPSELRRCIEDCQNCHRVCLSTASVHCLEVGGQHVSPKQFRLMLDCAEICETSTNFMLRNSQRHASVCRVCAKFAEHASKVAGKSVVWANVPKHADDVRTAVG